MQTKLISILALLLAAPASFAGVVNPPVVPGAFAPGVQYTSVQAQEWTTTSDMSTKVLAASTPPAFAPVKALMPGDIVVDPAQVKQSWLGVGCAITDTTAWLMTYDQSSAQRTALISSLYGPTSSGGAGFNFARVAFGACDFRHSGIYTFDDMPAGQTDPTMLNFSVGADTTYIIPRLQQIMAVNPQARVLAATWTPPQWMLATGTAGTAGETFNDTYHSAFASYLMASVNAYAGYGVPIWGLSPVNEPGAGTWMLYTTAEEQSLIGTYLGPMFLENSIPTRIFCYDDSWVYSGTPTSTTNVANQCAYVTGVLNSATAGSYTTGVMWHGYANSPAVGRWVKGQYPNNLQLMSEWRSLASTLITIPAGVSGGSFTISSTSPSALGPTAAITWSSNNTTLLANIQTALNATFGSGNITAAAFSLANGLGTISLTTQGGSYYGQTMTLSIASSLTGGTATLLPVTTKNGESPQLDEAGMAAALIGTARNGGSGYVAWNGALDERGGWFNGSDSSTRRGVVQINSSTGAVVYNPEFYVMAHSSEFVQQGASVIQSTSFGPPYIAYQTLPSTVIDTAWINPDGSVVCEVYNGSGASQTFQIEDARSQQAFTTTMAAGELSTYVWGTFSQRSPAASASVPAAPAAPVLTATGAAGQVNLSWTTPAGPIGYYEILRSATTGTETQLIQVPATTTTYSDLSGAGTFYYKVDAVSAGGASAASTEQSAVASAVAVPSAPASPSATAAVAGITIGWTPAVPNGQVVTVYNILRSTTTGTETALGTAIQGSTSYLDSSGTPGTQYFYKVAAVNATGTSANSTEVSATSITTPTLDAVSNATLAAGTTTLTWAHTCGSGFHRALFVSVGYSKHSANVSSVTYNGVAMTLVGSADAAFASSTDRSEDIWELVNPATGANNIVVTISSTGSAIAATAASYNYVNQSTPVRTAVISAGSAATSSITTTGGGANDVVICGINMRGSGAVTATGTSQTILTNVTQGTNNQDLLSAQPGGTGSIVSSWSWSGADNQAAVAVAIVPG